MYPFWSNDIHTTHILFGMPGLGGGVNVDQRAVMYVVDGDKMPII